MSFINNNNPREDTTFRLKVKDPIFRHHGMGGVVSALLGFRSANVVAREAGQPGINYEEFMSFLRAQGVDLRESEATYLCRAFDDDETGNASGFISEKTFIRHLLGLNKRRMLVVERTWETLPKNENGEASIEELVDLHEAFNGVRSGFRQGVRNAFTASNTRENRETLGRDPNCITYEEFAAYAAGLSLKMMTDEDFQSRLLREWHSDDPKKPLLNETERDWGVDGDPLAIDAPRYVKDALNFELGRSSKQYNYSHNQRYWREGIPLPQVDRPAIMISTVERTYVPYDKKAQDSADPLVTRRGQMY